MIYPIKFNDIFVNRPHIFITASLNLIRRFGKSIGNRGILWTYIIVILFFLFGSRGDLHGQSTVNKSKYSLFWKIDGNGLEKPSYLFGTMHIRDKRVFEFSDSVMVKFEMADVFAMEIHHDTLNEKIYRKSIENYIRKVNYDESYGNEWDYNPELGVGKDLDMTKFKKKTLRSLDNMLRKARKKKKDLMPVYLDAFLFYKAKVLGKKVIGLEKYEDQIALTEDINETETREIIKNSLDSLAYDNYYEQMIKIYQSGNIDALELFITAYKNDFSYRFLEIRNEKMVHTLEPAMKENSVFAAVGAAHLPGKNGLVQLLQKKGYEVTKVNATFDMEINTIAESDLEFEWYEYKDNKSGYSVHVPFRPISLDKAHMGIDMNVSKDEVTGSTYIFYGVPLSMASLTDDKDKSFDIIRDRITDAGLMNILQSKMIQFRGVPCLQMKLGIRGIFIGIARAFIVNEHLYLFMIQNRDENELKRDLKKYLESIRFHAPEIENIQLSDWETHSYSKGACSIQFPGKPEYYKQNIPAYGEINSGDYIQHMYYAQDILKKQVYLMSYYDLPVGYYYDNDSTVYQELFSSTYGAGYLFEPEKNNLILTNGIKGYEPHETASEEGFSIRQRVFLRGSRIYLLLTQTLPGEEYGPEAENFMNSLNLLPFKKTELSPYNFDSIKIPLPKEPVKTAGEEGGMWDNYLGINSYSSIDPNSGVNYFFNITEYSSFYRIKAIDSIYKESIEYLKLFSFPDFEITDSIPGSLDDGTPFVELIFNSDKSSSIIRYKMIYKNHKLYDLFAVYHSLQEGDLTIDSIFSSIDIGTNNLSFDPYTDRSKDIFVDLSSTDSLTFTWAKQALNFYEFDSTHINYFHEALFNSYRDSNANYSSTEDLILDLIVEHSNDESEGVLMDYYKENRENENAGDILYSFCDLESVNPEDLMELIREYPPIDLLYYQGYKVLDKICDSNENIDNDIVELKTLYGNNIQLQDAYISYLNLNMDSTGISNEVQHSIINDLKQWYTESLDSIRNPNVDDDDKIYYNSAVSGLISLYAHSGLPEYDQLVLEGGLGKLKIFFSDIMLYKTMRGLKTKKKDWNKLSNDDYYFYSFLLEMEENGKLGNVPDQYKGKREVALYMLKEFFYYDDYIPDYFDFINEIKVTKDSIDYVYYIYDFRYEGESEKYSAITGGFISDEQTFKFEDLNCNYSYDPVSDEESREKIIDNLIKYINE